MKLEFSGRFIQKITSSIAVPLFGQNFNIGYFSNAFWSFLEKFVKFIAEVSVGFYFARSIGVSDFGTFNYAISISILFQGISTLGLSEIVTRELVNKRADESRIINTALGARLAAALLCVATINILSWNEDPIVRHTIFAISLSLIFRSFEVIIYYFQSVVKLQIVSKTQIVITLIISLVKVYLILVQAPLSSFAWAYSMEWLIISLALLILYFRTKGKVNFSFSGRHLKGLMMDAWPLLSASVAINLYMRIDQIMIRELIGDVENGYYSAALRLTEIWYVIPMVIGSVFFPAILNAKNRDTALYYNRFRMLNTFLFWASFLLAVIISPLSEFIIVNLYNKSYQLAAPILSIQIWSGIFTFLGVAGTYWLMAENLQLYSLLRTLIALAINLTFNFFLIPVYGGLGAAISSLFTQAFAATLSLLLFRKTRKLFFIQIHGIIQPVSWLIKYLSIRTKVMM